MAVAIGYLLLAPLLAAANLQRQQSQALATSGGLRRDSERLQQMRQVVSSASSIPELEQRLAAVQGPRLDAADRTLTLPVLHSRIASVLDQASARQPLGPGGRHRPHQRGLPGVGCWLCRAGPVSRQ